MQGTVTEPVCWPDINGRFGDFGGRYVPETLVHPVEELERAYLAVRNDERFQSMLAKLLKDFAGRPTPLFYARRLTEKLGGGRVYWYATLKLGPG